MVVLVLFMPCPFLISPLFGHRWVDTVEGVRTLMVRKWGGGKVNVKLLFLNVFENFKKRIFRSSSGQCRMEIPLGFPAYTPLSATRL